MLVFVLVFCTRLLCPFFVLVFPKQVFCLPVLVLFFRVSLVSVLFFLCFWLVFLRFVLCAFFLYSLHCLLGGRKTSTRKRAHTKQGKTSKTSTKNEHKKRAQKTSNFPWDSEIGPGKNQCLRIGSNLCWIDLVLFVPREAWYKNHPCSYAVTRLLDQNRVLVSVK